MHPIRSELVDGLQSLWKTRYKLIIFGCIHTGLACLAKMKPKLCRIERKAKGAGCGYLLVVAVGSSLAGRWPATEWLRRFPVAHEFEQESASEYVRTPGSYAWADGYGCDRPGRNDQAVALQYCSMRSQLSRRIVQTAVAVSNPFPVKDGGSVLPLEVGGYGLLKCLTKQHGRGGCLSLQPSR